MEITDLTFVPQEGKRLDSDDPRRKFVRSHVSRRIIMQRRRGGAKVGLAEGIDKRTEERNGSESVGTSSPDQHEVARWTLEPTSVSHDPFDCLPIEAGHCEIHLLKYYASTWHKVRIPINPARAYLPIAIGNPALLHVTLLHAAMNSPYLCDPKFQTALTYHKWKSIEAVNESLRHSTFDTLTLTTVALLALLESADGSETACHAHMTGLRALATRVGKLKIDALNPLLRQTIRWIDVAGAMTLESPLVFPNTPDGIWNDLSFQTKTIVQVKHIAEKLYLITGSRILSQSSGTIFQHLKWLSNGISKISTSDVAGLEKLDFHTRLDDIERQCIQLRNQALRKTNGNFELIIAFSNASLIYICLIVRGYQRRLAMFEVLAQRTRKAIESIDWLKVDEILPDLLLWITMVASLALGEGEQKRWFCKRVRSIGGSMGLFTAIELAEKVRSFLWVENFVSREGLWQDGIDGRIEMERI